jgi:hypothetical protein
MFRRLRPPADDPALQSGSLSVAGDDPAEPPPKRRRKNSKRFPASAVHDRRRLLSRSLLDQHFSLDTLEALLARTGVACSPYYTGPVLPCECGSPLCELGLLVPSWVRSRHLKQAPPHAASPLDALARLVSLLDRVSWTVHRVLRALSQRARPRRSTSLASSSPSGPCRAP